MAFLCRVGRHRPCNGRNHACTCVEMMRQGWRLGPLPCFFCQLYTINLGIGLWILARDASRNVVGFRWEAGGGRRAGCGQRVGSWAVGGGMVWGLWWVGVFSRLRGRCRFNRFLKHFGIFMCRPSEMLQNGPATTQTPHRGRTLFGIGAPGRPSLPEWPWRHS